jgi:hypothetical protein
MLRVIETRVQDAITSLVAQVLGIGGQVVFGGHPAITPMVAATVAGFSVDREGEPPVRIYQSEYFHNAVSPVGREEMRKRGLAQVIPVPADPSKVPRSAESAFRRAVDWLSAGSNKDIWLSRQADPDAGKELVLALLLLRLVMFFDAQPTAAVCMGGMEGIEAEALLYQNLLEKSGDQEQTRLFGLRSTYGATARLEGPRVRFIEDQYLAERHPRKLQPSEGTAEEDLLRRIRYDEWMRQLVERVCELRLPSL